MSSEIYFDSEQNRWRLQSLLNPDKYLLMTDKNPRILPMGTHKWTLETPGAICNLEKGEKRILTLSRCFPDMYTCDTGHCIDLSNKCNTEINCKDKSDEYNCKYLRFGPNYAKELIPRDEKGETFVVYINVSVLAFPVIETVNLKFTVDFFLNLRWYDLRIAFQVNLHQSARLTSDHHG